MFRYIKIIFFTLLFFYLAFWTYLYINQKSLIYFPSKQNFNNCPWFSDFEKVNFNWTKFYFKKKSSENIIIFYHWNAWSACDRNYMKKYFETLDYSLLFVEYAWYADDNYDPNIILLYNDVTNIKTYVQSQNFSNIVVFWRSIWTWLATYNASIWKVDKLILVTPFTTFVELTSLKYPFYPIKYLLTEKYDNIINLENFKNSVLILHWDNDEIIPYNLWKNLFENLKTTQKEFLTISWKWHNDLEYDKDFYPKIIEFIKK